jgi:hypothetical protein
MHWKSKCALLKKAQYAGITYVSSCLTTIAHFQILPNLVTTIVPFRSYGQFVWLIAGHHNRVSGCGNLSSFFRTVPQKLGWLVTLIAIAIFKMNIAGEWSGSIYTYICLALGVMDGMWCLPMARYHVVNKKGWRKRCATRLCSVYIHREMVAVLGPYEALPYYIHTYIHTLYPSLQLKLCFTIYMVSLMMQG